MNLPRFAYLQEFQKTKRGKKKLRGLNWAGPRWRRKRTDRAGRREQSWAKAHLAPDLQKMDQKG
jgi:hypothetical protein